MCSHCCYNLTEFRTGVKLSSSEAVGKLMSVWHLTDIPLDVKLCQSPTGDDEVRSAFDQLVSVLFCDLITLAVPVFEKVSLWKEVWRKEERERERCTHKHVLTCTHKHKHTHTQCGACTHTHTYAHTHTHIHTHTHTCTHACTHIHTHTHTHAHTSLKKRRSISSESQTVLSTVSHDGFFIGR